MLILASILIFIVNPFIAFLNAKNCGLVWSHIYQSGIFQKILVISALIQSFIGFSMPTLGVLLIIGYFLKFITLNQINLSIDIFWISVIIPLIGSGIFITINSIKEAIKEKSLSSGMIAAWNIGSTIENIFDLVTNFKSIIDDFFKRSSDEDDTTVSLVIGLLLVSFLGGFVFTGLAFQYGKKQAYELS